MSTLKFDDLYTLTFKDTALNELGRLRFAEWISMAQSSNVPSQFTKAFQKEWFRYQNEDSTVPQYSVFVDDLHPIWGKIAAKLIKLELKDQYQARHANLYALAVARVKFFLELKEQTREHVDKDLLPILNQKGKEAYQFYQDNLEVEEGLDVNIDTLIRLRTKLNSMSSDYLDAQTQIGRLIHTVDNAEKEAILTLGLVWRDLRVSTYGDLPGSLGFAYKVLRTIKKMPTKKTLLGLQATVEAQFLTKQLVNNILILGQ